MDHNMVLSYDYAKRNRRRQRTNAPPLQTILMAMVRRWSNTCGIARCSMSRATLEATGRRHRATTRSVSPWRPPGQQQTKQQCIMYPLWWPFRWKLQCGITTRIPWWRRSRAFIKAATHHHRASTCSDNTQSDTPAPVVSSISSWKRARVDMLAPTNNGYDKSNCWEAPK